jgi:type 1 glutamine amidotransferase
MCVICADDFTPYVQHLEDFATSPPEVRRGYAAALFYFFPQASPPPETATAIEALLDEGLGCVVLHHALLAYPDWPVWDEVVGCAGRERFTYHQGTRYEATVVGDHPIVDGLGDWEMIDETYVMPEPAGTPLLRAQHPLSSTTIGWAHTCRSSRVVCLQPGHDPGAWAQEGYRSFLSRALRWVGGTRLARAATSDPAGQQSS